MDGARDVRQRRPLPQGREVLARPGKAVELGVHEVLVERRGVEADQVGHARRRDRRFEAGRLRDHPVGHVAAVAAARDEEAVAVEVRVSRERVVDAGHQVLVIAAAPIVDAAIGELLAVARAAARIDGEHA